MSVYYVEVTVKGRAILGVKAESAEEAIKKFERGEWDDYLDEDTEVEDVKRETLHKEEET